MNSFCINGTTYRALPFTFNLIIDLEDMGISISEIQKKPMSVIRAYFALCSKKDKDSAGAELESHLLAGGKFDDVFTAMSKEMEESDFFRSLSENKETEAATSQKSKKTSK